MNDRQILQLAAFERTEALLNANLPIIQGVSKIVETKSALETSINTIRLINVEEEKGTSGASAAFLLAKETLIHHTLTVQGSLIAYSTGENNLALTEAADFGASLFKRLQNEAIYDKCKLIHELASPLEPALKSDYQLPQGAIAQLGTALETYRLALPNKGLAKNEQTANTRKRKTAFAQAATVMTKLGKLMLMFRNTQPVFYESYLEAAHIGGNYRKPKTTTLVTGQVIDFETHQPIAEAKIGILLQQSETLSGADGHFSLTVATPGEITLQATKAGYTLWEDDMMIEQGETVTVLVEMEKGE